ncbi:hypothetical protein RISK_001122 [Rhodopirellula islandica]|uniref:Uncharacterized protein n=1 Tax=Rhodopirellula islandica TaxID=595434 RepID=A0A0J1BK51_RHOIS|nr:hypothetical protein RISK_001122 [Rhodopirellula islandica]
MPNQNASHDKHKGGQKWDTDPSIHGRHQHQTNENAWQKPRSRWPVSSHRSACRAQTRR